MTENLYSDNILLRDLHEHDLQAGDIGTLIDRHTVPGKEEGYSVEFFDMTGQTVALVTLPASNFRAPDSADRPATRTHARASSE